MAQVEICKFPLFINFLRTVSPTDHSRELKLAKMVESGASDKEIVEELLATLKEAETELRNKRPSACKDVEEIDYINS